METWDLSWRDMDGSGWGSCGRSGGDNLSGNLRCIEWWRRVPLWDVNYTSCNITGFQKAATSLVN